MKTNVIALAVLGLVSTTLSAQTIQTDPELAARLRTNDVLLLKAVHTGEQGPWKQFAAPDFFYLDEEGGVTYLDVFLKELAPITSRPLEIRSYRLSRAGDTAVVIHEDTDEQKVRYIFTETWQQLNGEWRLRALHITNILSDPPAIPLTRGELDHLAGTYGREGAVVTLRRAGESMIYTNTDGSDVELKAETRDMLFIPGAPRERFVFLRNPAGLVTAFLRRYETSDTLWSRTR